MARTLILIRHCKSDWYTGAASDHERPLNERGINAAPRIGRFLAQTCPGIDAVLCSDAARTRQTWAGISPQLRDAPRLQLSREIYHAGPEKLRALIAHAEGGVIAVIGHNPGIGLLAQELARTPPDHDRFDDYPTGATCVIEFNRAEWAGNGKGEVTQFVVPRDLPLA